MLASLAPLMRAAGLLAALPLLAHCGYTSHHRSYGALTHDVFGAQASARPGRDVGPLQGDQAVRIVNKLYDSMGDNPYTSGGGGGAKPVAAPSGNPFSMLAGH